MTIDLLPRLIELQARNCLLEHLLAASRAALGVIAARPDCAAHVAGETLAMIDRVSEGRL